MKKFIGFVVLIFVGVAGWRMGNSLSSDAISMALGMLFGMMAGIPAALLVLAAERRRSDQESMLRPRQEQPHAYPVQGHQPPVIVLTGPGMQMAPQNGGYVHANPAVMQSQMVDWPAQRPQRQFRVVGERDEWVKS